MKNAIIATLSLALLFFVLYSLGAFDAGDPIDRNYRSHFVKERERQVTRAREWLFGYLPTPGSDISNEVAAGMHFEADTVNEKGGLLGKRVRLESRAAKRMPQSQNLAIQHFCDNFTVAACLGPHYTVGVPSVRALSQFQGLPLFSPLTMHDPNLPKIEPDNYVPLLPPMSLWASAITARLKELEPRRVLIVGPNERASYGEFFSNACEISVRHTMPEAEIYRYNFDMNIINEGSQGFRQVIDLYKENRGLDAVIFAGTWKIFSLLSEALKNAGLNVPVFGSDLLHMQVLDMQVLDRQVPGDDAAESSEPAKPMLVPPVDLAIDFPLYVPVLVTKSMVGDFGRAWREKHGAAPSFWNFMGTVAVRLTCEAIELEGGYNVDALATRVRELVKWLWIEEAPEVRLHMLGKRPEKAGVDDRAEDGVNAGEDAAKELQDPDGFEARTGSPARTGPDRSDQ